MQQHELQLSSTASTSLRTTDRERDREGGAELINKKTPAIEQQYTIYIMAPKSLVLAAMLIAVVVSAGQLPRGSAGLGASPNTNTSFVVSGIVPCATGNSINLATVPSFPSKDTRI
jgi:hypothetical protein